MTGGFMPRRWPVLHVVVKSKDGELPDHIFEIAGQLAAYYSKGRTAPKVEIDYIQKKQVKKPAGAKPGFVVYYTNYSLMAEPSLKGSQGSLTTLPLYDIRVKRSKSRSCLHDKTFELGTRQT